MSESDDSTDKVKSTRRDFLIAGTAIAVGQNALAGCAPNEKPRVRQATEAQKALRKSGKSTVVIRRCQSYDEDIVGLLAKDFEYLKEKVSNRKVFLKVNMVDFREGKPLTTNPHIIAALIKIFSALGAANIAVGDGPALNRDTDYLLEVSGIGQCCKQENVPFVDLNIDDIIKVENPLGFTGLDHFLFPKTVAEADFIVSVPKLKTHRWARFTGSMKNLFGVIPGRRYGWPKSLLHQKGVDFSIVDLVASVKPSFSVVDAVVAMEGEGPLSGNAINSGLIVFGEDLAAVDSICARTMSIDPELVMYMQLAEQVIGNTQLADIEVIGGPLDSVTKAFVLPEFFRLPQNSKDAQRQSQFGAT